MLLITLTREDGSRVDVNPDFIVQTRSVERWSDEAEGKVAFTELRFQDGPDGQWRTMSVTETIEMVKDLANGYGR